MADLKKEADKLFDAHNDMLWELGSILELEPESDAGYGFFTQIIPEIKRLKEKADRYDAQEGGAR